MRRNGDAPMGEHLLKELFIRGLFQSNPWQVFSRHIDREIKKIDPVKLDQRRSG